MPEIAKEDISWLDDGEYWRAEGPHSIDPNAIQEIDYITAGGQRTGIRYATGPDQTGEVRMAYVKYPKSVWALEELQNSDGVPKFFTACNVCNYANHMRKVVASKYPITQSQPTSLPSFQSPSPPQYQPDQQQPVQYYQSPPQRISLGDVLPKYVPLALDVLRQIWLTRMGDLAFSAVGSVGADIVGGLSGDPAFKQTMRCVSDGLVDGVVSRCDEKYIEDVKEGIGGFVDAYRKDGDFLDAFIRSALKPTDEVLAKSGAPSKSRRPAGSSPRRARSFNTID